MLRRGAWGAGLAFEAATAALRAAAELPDQPVLVVTPAASHRARRLAAWLGFQETGTFAEYVRSRPSPSPRWARSGPPDRLEHREPA